MRRFFFTLVFFVLSAAVSAERIAPPALAPSTYADTEASTNIAIAVQDASRSFSVSLCALPQESLEVRNSQDGTQLIMR